ncbi:NCS1 family nucleobase:cation symporter-1 [Neptuniibacter halophilus]|uniref:NCS1 family nucleobase:cation symporter-1 n=1 Tax=Neptuniibacter halophilus TaxID=651666 RepID=UPI002573EE8F|nr:NCS1 family nucleobase:cation symporter-1 [Neptuniibacter halophilus]
MTHATNQPSTMLKMGEFYELSPGSDLEQSQHYNADIAPTRVQERNWNLWNVAALWVGMAICVPTYTLGGVLTAYFGLSVMEALMAILIANIIVLIPLTLNAFPGTKFGVPFPVVLRSSFGVLGSNIPCLIRALVACGWFGIQTLFGGLAIHILLSNILPGWESLGGTGEVIGFFLFLALNLYIVIRGAESIKLMETLAAPLLLGVGIGLMLWASPKISYEALLAIPANRPEEASFWGYFFAGVTAMVGFWATLSLNIPDFSRYVRSQKDQIIGQTIGLPLTMFFFAALGVVMTAASPALVGETISDPVTLIGKIDSPVWVVIAMLIIIVATLSTNTAANIVSPTNDFQNIAPRKINQTRGVLLTGLIGILLMGWELLKKLGMIESDVSVEAMYSGWLLGYSSLLGPIAGIMITDYFVVRRQQFELVELYSTHGAYSGFNRHGLTAFFVPVTLTLFALLTGELNWFYQYGWFTGSLLGGLIYWLSTRTVPYSVERSQLVAENP